MTDFFVNVNFLIDETAEIARKNILCIFRNPQSDPVVTTHRQPFKFLGCDLVDTMGSASALSNCGGFPDAFSNSELSRHGLINSRERAFEVQSALGTNHPEEAHADRHV